MGKKGRYCYSYPMPSVTTDCVVFGVEGNTLSLLLIKRANEPYKDSWALPGGFLDIDEEAETGARRELMEETGIEVPFLIESHAASKVGRDPRGRVISLIYFSLIDLLTVSPIGGDDAKVAKWFPLTTLPTLASDHHEIIHKVCIQINDVISNRSMYIDLFKRSLSGDMINAIDKDVKVYIEEKKKQYLP